MVKKKDSLGDRMKGSYENRSRYSLPRRTYTIIRIDGKAFHSYTRTCTRPYDLLLMAAMDRTMVALCKEIQGVRLGFCQSDEISLVLTDFEGTQTEAWFDGNIQKMASISASIATAHFNEIRRVQKLLDPQNECLQGADELVYFDSRVFTIPDYVEAHNYLVWRQQDATRNSISMMAQANFTHQDLQGKSSNQMQEMLHQELGINWNDCPVGFKRGRCAVRELVAKDVVRVDAAAGLEVLEENVERHEWRVVDPPIFTQDPGWFRERVPGRVE